ncbi:acetyltransferase [Longilinea arvoryzae]|uniref:Acetyltransferase n=1 Tax=Longilinea arvoryzae TaxID=360412 RepID=A0A0S7BLG6_9CHLR|nr:GNAT family protein [Longilinea arvoryzae]GAP15334.1 acetyltransferase [Longilinea arvoryzae]
MKFNTQLFESEHLILTWYDLDQDAAIEAGFTRNLDYAWRMDVDGIPHPLTTFEMKKKREEALKKSEENGSSFCYSLRTKEDNRFLGVVVLPWVSWVNRDAYFYLNFGHEKDEECYFEEAVHITLRYIFEELGLHHTQTWLGSHDDARTARYTRSGMAVEVCQRQMVYRQGRLWDRLSMGISQQDWMQLNAGE